MDLDFTNKDQLTHLELMWLMTGMRGARAVDRYVVINIRAHRAVCSQIRIATRWSGNADPRKDLVNLIEVPIL